MLIVKLLIVKNADKKSTISNQQFNNQISMDSLIETFHIDVKILISQIINFAIVFAVLYYFALKPLLKNMNERSKKIEKSLSDAERIEEALKKAEEERKEILSRAKKEAGVIVEQAAMHAEVKKNEMLERAKEEIGQVINKEKEKIRTEKEQVLKELKAEVTSLVIAVTEKVLGEKVDDKIDQNLIKKMVR